MACNPSNLSVPLCICRLKIHIERYTISPYNLYQSDVYAFFSFFSVLLKQIFSYSFRNCWKAIPTWAKTNLYLSVDITSPPSSSSFLHCLLFRHLLLLLPPPLQLLLHLYLHFHLHLLLRHRLLHCLLLQFCIFCFFFILISSVASSAASSFLHTTNTNSSHFNNNIISYVVLI